MTGIEEVKKAIVTKCRADSTLMGLIQYVGDGIPKVTKYPYVWVGEAIETPNNTFDRKGREVLMTLHIYSEHLGFHEADVILSHLNRLLDYQPLLLESYSSVYCRYEQGNWIVQADGVIHQIPAQYRIFVQE